MSVIYLLLLKYNKTYSCLATVKSLDVDKHLHSPFPVTLGDARDMKRNMEIQLEKLIKAEKEEIKKKEEEQRKKKEEEEIIKKEEEERIMREKDDERREKNRSLFQYQLYSLIFLNYYCKWYIFSGSEYDR